MKYEHFNIGHYQKIIRVLKIRNFEKKFNFISDSIKNSFGQHVVLKPKVFFKL